MNIIRMLLLGAAAIPACLFASENTDSSANSRGKELELNDVIVIAKRPVVKQQEGKLTYLVKNDPYAKGLDGVSLIGRLPRVSVNNGAVSVAGKGNVRYIIDGVLMELDASAMSMRLQNLRAENIEKIELLTTPPSRYAVEPNAVYISITTRNENLGTRGSLYGSLNQGIRLREYFSGSISHTTRKVELALDASVSNYLNTNNNEIEYSFLDKTESRVSSSRSDSHLFDSGVNTLFRYKVNPSMSMGVIANFNYETASDHGHNFTDYGNRTSSSYSITKSRPNNALTITGFYDWVLGKKGELLQVTYNYFNRHSPSISKISTSYDDIEEKYSINEDGNTDYQFHSGKVDFRLPFNWAQLETGVAYTDILNKSDNQLSRITDLYPAKSSETNLFDYSERIAAAYLTASHSLGNGFWAKAGLRYEYTWTEGKQMSISQVNKNRYGHIFPTLNLSWNKNGLGSFNVNYSMGMGRPNLWELNPFRYYSTIDEYAAGNPELKPTIYNNAEINYYGLGGLYAVLYTSFASDAIGYFRGFNQSGVLSTIPYNCLSTNKTGLYANYKRNLFGRWEIKLGGDIFRTYSYNHLPEFKLNKMQDWSGKLECSTDVMLNRQKTLIFGAQFTHFFPWQQNLINYESFQLFNLSIRYSLFNNRLNIQLKANDIFGWNKTRSKEQYAGYTIRQTFNPHSAYVMLGISYRLGRDKVTNAFRPSKEDQSRRTR